MLRKSTKTIANRSTRLELCKYFSIFFKWEVCDTEKPLWLFIYCMWKIILWFMSPPSLGWTCGWDSVRIQFSDLVWFVLRSVKLTLLQFYLRFCSVLLLRSIGLVGLSEKLTILISVRFVSINYWFGFMLTLTQCLNEILYRTSTLGKVREKFELRKTELSIWTKEKMN